MNTNKNNLNQDTIPFEHERRFVPDINTLPFDYRDYPQKLITQGYLEDELKTRMRDEMDGETHTYFQTRKTGHGVSRIEDEREITKEEFTPLWKNIEYSLSKSRYFIEYDGINVELNIFHGRLEGYTQIEVEFPSHADAINFVPPSWIGVEVTDNKEHGNYHLAKYGLPKQ